MLPKQLCAVFCLFVYLFVWEDAKIFALHFIHYSAFLVFRNSKVFNNNFSLNVNILILTWTVKNKV